MEDSRRSEKSQMQPRRKRGRPPGSRRKAEVAETSSSGGVENEEQLAYTLVEEHLTQFSSLLRKLVKRDRTEIIRVARELEVSENTVYRWMNGNSEPRATHLRRLLEIFPNQQESLTYAIVQTFGEVPDLHLQHVREVDKRVYQHILEMLGAISDPEIRFWEMLGAIFTYGLKQFSRNNRGVAMTFAKMMPLREDGVHSLREVFMRGTPPWPQASQNGVYLGSTSLAGTAVDLQRFQIWDESDSAGRTQVEIDLFERSACAIPIMRGNLIGGVLIVSSTQVRFFHDPMVCQAIKEYALMVSIALQDQDFIPYNQVCLRPMPHLVWQREQIQQSYKSRILAYVRIHGVSRREAEVRVQSELESEFEEKAHMYLEQTESPVSAYTDVETLSNFPLSSSG